MNPILLRFFQTLAAKGYELEESRIPAIIAAVDGFTDDGLNKATTAIAQSLPSGGVKSVEFSGIKSALISAEPQLDEIANGKIDELFTAVEAAVKGS